jgi:hypothetical protein
MKTDVSWMKDVNKTDEIAVILARGERQRLINSAPTYALTLVREREVHTNKTKRIEKNRERNKAARKARKGSR